MEDPDLLKHQTTQPESIQRKQIPTNKPKCAEPRKSELSQKVDSGSILTRILATSCPMTVGEVVGLSKDIASELQDLLKVRKPETTSLTVAYTEERGSRRLLGGLLITVPVEVDGRKVRAIIDSRSEINILNSRIYQQATCLPIDKS
ncbi:hypothetical protein JAAARDRAFT_129369, partial [Jaapia argillacea MUCL 33604]